MAVLRALGLVLLLVPGVVCADALRVRFTGLSGAPLQNVEALVDIVSEQRRGEVLASRIRQLHALAPEQIKRALEPFGYYRVVVRGRLTQAAEQWEAVYELNLGPPVRLRQVERRLTGPGADEPALRALIDQFPLAAGDVLDHARYENAKQDLQRRAIALGYLDAVLVTQRIELDLQAYTARVALHLDTGARYRFGRLSFIQAPETFDETLLRRYIVFAEGDPYRGRSLLALRTSLVDSGLFEVVEVRPRRDQARDYVVPVEVHLTARKRSRYQFGLGYGTDSGVRGSILYARRVGRKGHRIDAGLRLSERLRSANIQYFVPLRDPRHEQFTISASLNETDTESRDSDIATLGISRTALQGPWQRTLSLTYERERFAVGLQRGRSELLIPAVSWTRTEADDRLFPLRGYRIGVDVLGGAEDLGSDVSFAQLRLAGKWVRGLNTDTRLIARGRVGATWVERPDALPPSKRFFAGGDQSVRGYAYEALGPRDDSDEVVGGRYLLEGSLELERRLFGKWSVAAFVDAGNAFDEADDGLRSAAGIGLRWRSPVGPIRLDLASALSESGNPLRVHLVIGPEF